MIISRTPFRISLFGGGTDYPIHYKKHGGAVLASSINKYCYITCRYLPPFFEHKNRIVYREVELTKKIGEIKHPSVRECLNFMKINKGVEIHHDGDLPARAGLGTSSSFTVGLLNVLYALKGKIVTKRQLALDAIHVEQDRIKENVGSQDQITAAFGGFNKIEFDGDEVFQVQPVTLKSEKIQLLQDNMMLFFTGFNRTASMIAHEQIKKTPEREKELKRMAEMVDEAVDILNENDSDLTDFGKLLHENWMIKRKLTSKITTSQIDKIYEKARKNGALGGKLLGAGGGGFMLLFVEPDKQKKIMDKLKNLLYVPFCFEKLGSQIIYYSRSEETI
jgi:D-glycero-alpha-D-manno-heptose-7-phosphate kinase